MSINERIIKVSEKLRVDKGVVKMLLYSIYGNNTTVDVNKQLEILEKA